MVTCSGCSASVKADDPEAKWFSKQKDARTGRLSNIGPACLDCGILHKKTGPWMEFDEWVEERGAHVDEEALAKAKLQSATPLEERDFLGSSVSRKTRGFCRVSRVGTFLTPQQFENHFGFSHVKMGMNLTDLKKETGVEKEKGIFLHGVQLQQFRLVELGYEYSVDMSRELLLPQNHLFEDQDVKAFEAYFEKEFREGARGNLFKQRVRASDILATLEEKAAKLREEAAPAAADDASCGDATEVATVAAPLSCTTPSPKFKRSTGSVASDPLPNESSSTNPKEMSVDSWVVKLDPTKVLAGWKPGRLCGHAQKRADDLLHSTDAGTQNEGRRLTKHLELVDSCKNLALERMFLLDTAGVKTRLQRIAHSRVGCPTAFKESVVQWFVKCDVEGIMSGTDQNVRDANLKTLFSRLSLAKQPETFNPLSPRLCDSDGTPTERAETFGTLVANSIIVPMVASGEPASEALRHTCQIFIALLEEELMAPELDRM